MRTKLGLRLALASLLALAACSGDDDDAPTNADAGAKGGGGSSAAGGGKGTGSGKEGVECKSNADCASSFSCLEADRRLPDLKVCARPCRDDDQCEDNERCLSATEEPSDALCWNIETEALKPCGAAHTARCDESKNLGCLFVEEEGSVAGGVCLSPCELGKDNACASGFACLDIIDEDARGLCAKTVDRGDVCDEPKGEFCGGGNLCLSDGSEWRCYQDCSESDACDDNKECKALAGDDQGSYCE